MPTRQRSLYIDYDVPYSLEKGPETPLKAQTVLHSERLRSGIVGPALLILLILLIQVLSYSTYLHLEAREPYVGAVFTLVKVAAVPSLRGSDGVRRAGTGFCYRAAAVCRDGITPTTASGCLSHVVLGHPRCTREAHALLRSSRGNPPRRTYFSMFECLYRLYFIHQNGMDSVVVMLASELIYFIYFR